MEDASLKSRFIEDLVRENRLETLGFENLVFAPGMLFGATEKWWGSPGLRPAPHPGLDLCLFSGRGGEFFRFDETTKIPLAFDGEWAGLTHDFLGKTLFFRHDILDQKGRRLFTLYGHTHPASDFSPGDTVAQGEIIAVIAGIGDREETLLPHLHLTLAWIHEEVDPDGWNWDTISSRRGISLTDPLDALNGSHTRQALERSTLRAFRTCGAATPWRDRRREEKS